MPNKEEKRLGVDLPKEMIRDLHGYVPWGRKKYLYEAITRQLLEMLEKADEPQMVIAMIIKDEIKVEEFIDHEAT